MSLSLTAEDLGIINELRGLKILEDVDSHRISAPNGFMAFLCSDCDHIRDKFEFLCSICKDKSHSERVHLFACHSGGLLLSPTSPTKKGDEHRIFTEHMKDAMPMKGMSLLVSKCHAPCGAAYAKGLNFNQVLRHTFEGKLFAKTAMPDLRVAVFTQICYDTPQGKKRRTYAVEGKKWWNYAAQKNII